MSKTKTHHATSNLAIQSLIAKECGENRFLLERINRDTEIWTSFARMLEIVADGIERGGKVLLFGNGGSASHAQHLATELMIRYEHVRAPIAALALSADSSIVTACANDFDFERIFSRQIEALARPHDIAIAISTSGKSRNVINALTTARSYELATVGLTGCDGGELPALCDACIVIPSHTTARIQEMQLLIGHMLCKALDPRPEPKFIR